MDYQNVIDLSKSCWDKESFIEGVKRVEKAVIDLMANALPGYQIEINELGFVLDFLEQLSATPIVDNMQKQ